MHLAIVSPADAANVRAWSGIPYFVARALREQTERISLVSPLPAPATAAQRVRQLKLRLRGTRYMRHHSLAVAEAMGAYATERIRALAPDAVLSIGSTPVGFIDVRQPIAFWSDATFESNLHFYAEYSGLDEQNAIEGNLVEQAAQDRASCAIYAAEYAARSAREYYGTDPSRVHVVPFGSNLVTEPPAESVEASIAARPLDRCQLLFLGADWTRKGGDVAVRVADELNAAGLPTELVVAGPTPLLDRPRPYVRRLGFVDKGTPEGKAQFDRLLASSHFLLLPTRAEAFGCVFGEAGAYGVPSLTADAGGPSSAVADGVSGVVFPWRTGPQVIAERIRELLAAPETYRSLCRGARARYEDVLNWPVATRRVVDILTQHVR